MKLSVVPAASVLPDDNSHVERSRDIYKSLMYADYIDIQ